LFFTRSNSWIFKSLYNRKTNLPDFRKYNWWAHGEGWAIHRKFRQRIRPITDPYQYFGMLGKWNAQGWLLTQDTGWTRALFNFQWQMRPKANAITTEIERYGYSWTSLIA
jgi:uncharacterized protein (DUF885 family)